MVCCLLLQNEIKEVRTKAEQQVATLKKQFSAKVATFREKLAAREKERHQTREQASSAEEQASVVNQLQDEVERLKELVKAKEEALSIVDVGRDDVDGINVVKLVEESEFLRQEVERLRTALEEKSLEIEAAVNEKDTVLEQLSMVSSEFDAFKQQSLDEKDDLVTSLECSNADLLKKEEELCARNAEVSRLETERVSAEDKVREINSQLEKLESENTNLRSQLHDSSAETADLVHDKASLEKVIEEQQTARLEMKDQMEQERWQEAQRLKEENVKAKELCESRKQEMERLASELAGAQQRFTCQQSETQAERDEEKQKWNKEKEALMSETRRLEVDIRDLQTLHESTVSQLRQQLDEEQEVKTRQLSELKRDLTDMTHRLQSAESTKEEMIHQLEREKFRLVGESESEEKDDMSTRLQEEKGQATPCAVQQEPLSLIVPSQNETLRDEKATLELEKEELTVQLKGKEEELKQLLSEQAEKYETRINRIKIQAKAKITAMQRKQQQQQEEQSSLDTSLQSVDANDGNWQSKLQTRMRQLDEMEARVEKERVQTRGASPVVASEAGQDATLPTQEDFEREVAEVRDALKSKDFEYATLQQTYGKLEESHNELVDSHNQLLKRHAQMVTDQRQLDSEVARLKAQAALLAEAERRADDAKEDARSLGDQLGSVRHDLMLKEDTVHDLEKRLRESETEISEIQDEVASLKQERQDAVLQREQMQREVETLKEMDMDLAREADEKARLLERLEQSEKGMIHMAEEEQKKIKSLEVEIQEMTVRLEEAQSTIEFQEKELVALQQDKHELQSDVSKLEVKFGEEKRDWQAQISDLFTEKGAVVEELRRKDAELTEETDTYRHKLEAMEAARLESVKAVDQLQFAQQEAQTLEMQLREEKQLLEQQLAETTKRLSVVETDYESRMKEMQDEVMHREEGLNATIEELENERDVTSNQMVELSSLNTSLHEDSDQLQTDLTAREQTVGSLEHRVSELSGKLQMARQTAESRDAELVDLRQQLQAQMHEVTSLTGTLTSMSEEQRQLQEKLQKTTRECQDHECSVAVLRSQVNEIDVVRETLETQKSELTQSVQTKANQTLQLEEERKALSGEFASCMAKLDVSQGNESRLGRELAAVMEERSRLELDFNASLRMLQGQLSDSTSQLEGLKRQLVVKQQAVEDTERQLHVEKHELHELRKELEKSRDAYRSLVDEDDIKNREMQARIHLLEGELTDLRSHLNQVTAERDELTVHHTERLADLQIHNSLSQERDHLQKENETLTSQLHDIQQQVQDIESDRERTGGRMVQLQTENAELNRLKGELEVGCTFTILHCRCDSLLQRNLFVLNTRSFWNLRMP